MVKGIVEDGGPGAGMGRWTPPWAPDLGALWIRGQAPSRPGVAVVGARASDPYGLAVAGRCALAALDLGRAVISGGAEGCDKAAHEAALARGGPTVVVLAGGLDRLYPAAHRPLFERVVAQGGALVSAYGPGTPPRPHRFLERNRLIAALSQGVIVVRARARSGSLSTARAALDRSVPLLAVPGPLGRELSVGPNELLARGRALAMTGPGALAQAMGLPPFKGAEPWPITAEACPEPFRMVNDSFFPQEEGRSPEGESLLGVLRAHETLDLASLSRLTRLSTGVVMALLVELEVAGEVHQRAGRYGARDHEPAPPVLPLNTKTRNRGQSHG